MIYLLTLSQKYKLFGSAGQSWKNLDINKITGLLDHDVKVIVFEDLEDINLKKEDIIIYTSSENYEVRQYIKNKMYFVKDKCKIIPRYDLLMAHEDKGFQELLKKEYNIGNLNGNYVFDIDNLSLPLPKVLKTSEGAGSSGVFLVKNNKEVTAVKDSFFKQTLKRKVIKAQRRIKLSSAEYNIYTYRYKTFKPFVEQEFIPHLKHDFKVLVFGNRYFVLKRSVRKNDFRASGSGNFEFIDPPHEVLEFAKEVSASLDNPYLSLDIAQSDTGCHLIELQATNFGPYTLLNAPTRYVDKKGQWVTEKNCKDLSANYAYAIQYYLSKHYA